MTAKVVKWGDLKEETLKDVKPIKLVKYIQKNKDYVEIINACSVNNYDHVSLIHKSTGYSEEDDYDIIMCWNHKSGCKLLYLGHWNDGVVE